MWCASSAAGLQAGAAKRSFELRKQPHMCLLPASICWLPAVSRRDAAPCCCCSHAELLQEGPVHDVQWAPEGGRFCVIAGYMPAQVRHSLRSYCMTSVSGALLHTLLRKLCVCASSDAAAAVPSWPRRMQLFELSLQSAGDHLRGPLPAAGKPGQPSLQPRALEPPGVCLPDPEPAPLAATWALYLACHLSFCKGLDSDCSCYQGAD